MPVPEAETPGLRTGVTGMTRMLKFLALMTLPALVSACGHLPVAGAPQAEFDLGAWLESQRGKTPETSDWPNAVIATTELR